MEHNGTNILVINFGSTSTKIAIFNGKEPVFIKSYDHGSDEYPGKFKDLNEHQQFAMGLIDGIVKDNGYAYEDFDVFVARGGAQVFIESGAYLINDVMLEDTYKIGGERHPGKLGTRICYELGKKYGKPAYIYNGPSVDEYRDEARLTGLHEIIRSSHIHTLNQKEVAHRYADKVGKKYEDLNLIVCHLGGGMTITAHRKGRMIDSSDSVEGDGPMAPTRAGSLPANPLIDLCFSGEYKKEELIVRLVKNGGLMDHLGTADLREVEKRSADGDAFAKIVYDTMVYQITKYAGQMAAALEGKVDAVLLTGGMARSEKLVAALTEKLTWIAPVDAFPGEFEMEGLAAGALRVIRGEEQPKTYTGQDVWRGFPGQPDRGNTKQA